MLVHSSGRALYGYNVTSGSSFTVATTDVAVSVLDVDSSRRHVYWVDATRMRRAILNDNATLFAQPQDLCSVRNATGIAYDWIARSVKRQPASAIYRCLLDSRPTDHYFRSVCWFACLFVQSFSQPSLIRFRSNLDICYMSGFVDDVMFSNNGANTETGLECAMRRIIHRNSADGATKLRTRGRSQLSLTDRLGFACCLIILALFPSLVRIY